MARAFLRKIASLSIEEKILNAGLLLTIVSMFFPWFGGRWIGDELRTYNGFGFYTSFIGVTLLALNVYALMITVTPMTSKTQLVRKERRDIVRLCCTTVSTILILASLSVLIRVTFEFQAMEVRFGVGSALFGSLASMFYSFIKLQTSKRDEVLSLFHQDAPTGDEYTETPVDQDIERITEDAKRELLDETNQQEKKPRPQPTETHSAQFAPPPPPPPESHTSRYL